MRNRPPRCLRFVKAELQPLSPTKCLARVQLEHSGFGSYVGTAVGGCPEAEGLRATAEAATAALMQAMGPDHTLEVFDVEEFVAFGQPAVLVHVGAKLPERSQALMGFCLAGADSTRAAALAVLDAANRVLGVG